MHLVLHFKGARILCLPGPSQVYQKCHSDWRKSDSYGSGLGYLEKQKQILIKDFFSKAQRLWLYISSTLVDDDGHGDDALATIKVGAQTRLNGKYEKSPITC